MNIAPVRVFAVDNGRYRIEFGSAEVDATVQMVQSLGHEPNGEFWMAIAQLYVLESVPELDGEIEYDPEAGAFSAYAANREALMRLADRMARAVNDPAEVKAAVDRASRAGIVFDD